MSYCPNCGVQLLEEGMNFCPNCGTALNSTVVYTSDQPVAPEVPVVETVAQPANTVAQPTTVNIYQTTANPSGAYSWASPTGLTAYSLILVSRGSCTKSLARTIIRDVLGYTWAETLKIVNSTPMEIAHNMSLQQVVDLARVLTEYGMQVSVYNSNGYVNLGSYATSAALNSSGSFLQSVATTLATLTVANRVNRLLKWSLSSPLDYLFRPKYRYVRPVRYVRPSFSLLGTPRPKKPSLLSALFSPRPAPKPRPQPRPSGFSLFGNPRPTSKPKPAPKPQAAPKPKPTSKPSSGFSLFGGSSNSRKTSKPASSPRPSASKPASTSRPSSSKPSSRPSSSSRPVTPGGFGRKR